MNKAFAELCLNRLAMLAFRFGIGDLGLRISKSQITNPKFEIETRTTGLEPAIFSLKGWRLNLFAYVHEMRVKRFELLHKLGLSQSPLPLGYTRSGKNITRGKI